MRIISLKTLRAFWVRYPQAQQPLRIWYKTTGAAQWRNFVEVRATFGSADAVRVASGNTVVVFDIGGNKYRLIAAIHYNTERVYALMVLSHAEYDRNAWRDQL
jgi:mRNA interferase HigB